MLGRDLDVFHSSRAATRFNLLQLEVGEFYLEDFSVVLYPQAYSPFQRDIQHGRKAQGRLKVSFSALPLSQA